jgi:sodium transport system permease protein
MPQALIVFKKEITDILRDRRTLIAMVLVPLLLFPLLFVGGTWLVRNQMEEAAEKTIQVAVIGAEQEPARGAVRRLGTAPNIDIVEGMSADTARARVQRQDLDAALVFGDTFGEAIQDRRAGAVDIMYRSDDDSGVMLRRINGVLDAYEQQLLSARFEALGLSTEATRAVQVREVDLATEQEQIAQAIGGFLPYVFLIFCFAGAMYPAIDLGAGEKERGTLETLLVTPVSRMQVLMGKTAAIALAGIFSAIVSILSIGLSVQFIDDIPANMMEAAQSVIAPGTVALLLSLLLPLTIFFAAAQLALSFYAKSFKEAQSIINPLLIAVIFPAFIGLLPGFELNVTTALIPILNISLATKSILGGTVEWGLIGLTFASLIVLAGVALVVCAQLFRRESIIFRT